MQPAITPVCPTPGSTPLSKALALAVDPSAAFRPMPLWAWNDALDEVELRHQVARFADAGLGGFIIHGRAGLRSGYLDDSWEHSVGVALDECRRHNLRAWIYDEWGWPSGFAAGRIPALGTDWQQQFLLFDHVDLGDACLDADIIGFYRLDERRTYITGMPTHADGSKVLRIRRGVNPYYVDLLNPETTRAFIRHVYTWYEERFSADFGRTIPGFFTDEPQYARAHTVWSPILPELFRQEHGTDLIPLLGALCFDVPDGGRTRLRYWSLVRELYLEGYAGQLKKWCEPRGLLFTGHVLLEEEARWQVVSSGSAMGFYHREDIPGIDWLGRRIGNAVVCRQAQSAAEQSGRSRVISEMFGCAGWGTTFADFKWMADWQYAGGVNLVCQHLAGYSIRGARKRDYPPGMNFQSAWWPLYRHFNDACGRLSVMMAHGSASAEVLVIHPLNSACMETISPESSQADWNVEFMKPPSTGSADGDLLALATLLESLRWGFHFGDEDFMSGHARIDNQGICVGERVYRVVIIPSMCNLASTTASFLLDFAAMGGHLFHIEPFPTHLDGEPTAGNLAKLREASKPLLLDASEIDTTLSKLITPPLLYRSSSRDVQMLVKEYKGGGLAVFLFNRSIDNSAQGEVILRDGGTLQELDQLNGSLAAVHGDPGSGFHVALAPRESRFLVVDGAPPAGDSHHGALSSLRIDLDMDWLQATKEPNNLVLDMCRWRALPGGEWSAVKPVYTVQKELLEGRRNLLVELEYTFEVAADFAIPSSVQIMLEEGRSQKVFLNGHALDHRDSEPWIEKFYHSFECGSQLLCGRNVLSIHMEFAQSREVWTRVIKGAEYESEVNMLGFDSEVEAAILRGHFQVECHGVSPSDRGEEVFAGSPDLWASRENALIIEPPLRLGNLPVETRGADASPCGRPFHCGAMWFHQDVRIDAPFSKAVLHLDQFNAAAGEVFVNGTPCGPLLWAPHRVDVTEALRIGANRLSLRLLSTNRNLFGPHHNPMGEVPALGPDQFTEKFGWKDDYCVLSFGPGRDCWIEVMSESLDRGQ